MTDDDAHDDARDRSDGIDRRGFLKCMAWAGTSVVWTVSGGVLSSVEAVDSKFPAGAGKDIFFVQISDSHIGFTGSANADVTHTFEQAIAQVNSLPERPRFVMHTGDLTHTSAEKEFGTVQQLFSTLKTGRVFQVPGEHDALAAGDKRYLQFFGKGTVGDGYYSFDVNGVHFLALVNSVALEGPGHLGTAQLDWIKKDLAGLSSETPLVVFAHIPLFAMYPKWGWSTDDALQALGMMRRFGAVTVLNGHVHQIMSKTEGNITFHTARATGYPLPQPGQGPGPVPLTVPTNRLHSMLGIREATFVARDRRVAIKDDTLAGQ